MRTNVRSFATWLTGWAVAAVLAVTPVTVLASGGGGANSGGANSGGGGGGKVLTVKYTGIVTEMHQTADGIVVTVGNLYYNTGTVLVTPDCKVVVDGSNGSIFDVDVGDTATITATLQGVAVKVESISAP
jgi:hypothetical protein